MRRFETGVTKLWQKNQNYIIFIEIVHFSLSTFNGKPKKKKNETKNANFQVF